MAAGQAAEQAAIFTLVVLYNLLVLTQRNGDSNRHGETNQSFHGAWSQSLSVSLVPKPWFETTTQMTCVAGWMMGTQQSMVDLGSSWYVTRVATVNKMTLDWHDLFNHPHPNEARGHGQDRQEDWEEIRIQVPRRQFGKSVTRDQMTSSQKFPAVMPYTIVWSNSI